MRWSILLICTLWLALCGQKGPLYLPDNDPTDRDQPQTTGADSQSTLTVRFAKHEPWA